MRPSELLHAYSIQRSPVQILHLQGIRYVFQLNIFLYCLFAFMGLTILCLSFTKPKRWARVSKDKQLENAYS